MSRVYLSLGSNLGHRLNNLRLAVHLLQKKYLKDLRYSIVLETEALLQEGSEPSWNKPYLNMIISATSELLPREMLGYIKEVEQEMGRPTHYKGWSPRVIDIDILYWEGVTLNESDLTIPHKELNKRPFFISLLAMMQAKYQDIDFPRELEYIHYQPFIPLRSMVLHPQIVGIVNITPDSFSDGGQYETIDLALTQIRKLIEEGASIIELGGQSTRPGSLQCNYQAEWARLEPILEALNTEEFMNVPLSIDTYHPEIIIKLRNYSNILYINDVTGAQNDILMRNIANLGYNLIAMHSLSIPPSTKNILSLSAPAIEQIISWSKQTLKKCIDFGIKKVIIDPGIGFGKSSYQALNIICNLDKISSFSEVMIGHSRKSLFQFLGKESALERDFYTAALGSSLLHQVSYLRVHNVYAQHMTLVSNYNVW